MSTDADERAVAATEPRREPAVRVTTLELFFDLVFVFTVTQLASLLVNHLDLLHTARMMLMLALIWWMYSGYAWLTNAVAPTSTLRRTLLLTGMAGFLLIALAIPGAFRTDGWAFGAGYVVVTAVHAVLFLHADEGTFSARRAISGLAPLNAASAGLVLVGGLTPGGWRFALWAAAFVLQVLTPYLHPMGEWRINAGHFVERHGLVVLIAIGESVVAVGLAFAGLRLDLLAVATATLGLSIAYYLYWNYFSGDEERAEHALALVVEPARRGLIAIRAWGYAHYFMIAGVVFVAIGVKLSVGHATEPLRWPSAIALSGGAAMFLLGHAWFLSILGLPGRWYRVLAAIGVLAVIPLGPLVAVAQLAGVLLIMMAAVIARDIPAVRRRHTTAIHDFGRTAKEPE